MDDLIAALTILGKYMPKDTYSPTHCEHDVMMVMVHDPVSDEDIDKLDELGFIWSSEYNCYISFRFGSA